MESGNSKVTTLGEARCDLTEFLKDLLDAEAGVFRLTDWGQHSFVYSRPSPQHVRVLQENGCGLHILRHGRCTQDIHNYFRKYELHKCCLGLVGGQSLRTKLRLIKSDSLSHCSVDVGVDVASSTSSSSYASQVDLKLSDEEYRAFKCALWCAVCPLLTAQKPPDDTSPPSSPSEDHRSSDVDIELLRRFSHSFSRLHSVTVLNYNTGDASLISSEIMREVLRRAFGLNKHLELYYLKLAYKFHKTKNDAQILAEDLCYQLSLLEKDANPYYNTKSFMSQSAYNLWRLSTRRHLMELMNKFWSSALPPVGDVVKFDAHSIHSDYRLLLHKLLRLQKIQYSKDPSTEAFTALPSGATRKILTEFSLRYGIDELYHLATYLEYLLLNFGIEKHFVDLVTQTIRNILSLLPSEKAAALLVRQQVDQFRSCVDLVLCRCEHLFSHIQTVFVSTNCSDSIGSLISLLEEALLLQDYLGSGEAKPTSAGKMLQSFLEINFQLVYIDHKTSALSDASSRGEIGQLSPRVINRIMCCLRDDLTDYCNNYKIHFERYFDIVELSSVALYDLLMQDVVELCQQIRTLNDVPKVNFGMIGLIYRLNMLDNDLKDFIPLSKQTWRQACIDLVTCWFSALYHQGQYFLLSSVAKDQFIPLHIPQKFLSNEGRFRCVAGPTVSLLQSKPSAFSIVTACPHNQTSENQDDLAAVGQAVSQDEEVPSFSSASATDFKVSYSFETDCADVVLGNQNSGDKDNYPSVNAEYDSNCLTYTAETGIKIHSGDKCQPNSLNVSDVPQTMCDQTTCDVLRTTQSVLITSSAVYVPAISDCLSVSESVITMLDELPAVCPITEGEFLSASQSVLTESAEMPASECVAAAAGEDTTRVQKEDAGVYYQPNGCSDVAVPTLDDFLPALSESLPLSSETVSCGFIGEKPFRDSDSCAAAADVACGTENSSYVSLLDAVEPALDSVVHTLCDISVTSSSHTVTASSGNIPVLCSPSDYHLSDVVKPISLETENLYNMTSSEQNEPVKNTFPLPLVIPLPITTEPVGATESLSSVEVSETKVDKVLPTVNLENDLENENLKGATETNQNVGGRNSVSHSSEKQSNQTTEQSNDVNKESNISNRGQFDDQTEQFSGDKEIVSSSEENSSVAGKQTDIAGEESPCAKGKSIDTVEKSDGAKEQLLGTRNQLCGIKEQSSCGHLLDAADELLDEKTESSSISEEDEVSSNSSQNSSLPNLKFVSHLTESTNHNVGKSDLVQSPLSLPVCVLKDEFSDMQRSSLRQSCDLSCHQIPQHRTSSAPETQSLTDQQSSNSIGGRQNHPHNVMVLVTSSLIDFISLLQRLIYATETLIGALYLPSETCQGLSVTEVTDKMEHLQASLRDHLEEIIKNLILLYAKNFLAMDLCALSPKTAASLTGHQLVEDLKRSREYIWGCRHKVAGTNCLQYVNRHEEFRDGQYEPLTKEMCLRINNILQLRKMVQTFFRSVSVTQPSSCSAKDSDVSLRITEDYLNETVVGLVNILVYRMQHFISNFLNQLVLSKLPNRSELERTLQPLKCFLSDALTSLQRWLCAENYSALLDRLWLSLSWSFEKCALDVQANPSASSDQLADCLLQTIVIVIRLVTKLNLSDPDHLNIQHLDAVLYWLQLYSQPTPRLISIYELLCLKRSLESRDSSLPFGSDLQAYEKMRQDLHSSRKCFLGQQLIDWISSHPDAFLAAKSQANVSCENMNRETDDPEMPVNPEMSVDPDLSVDHCTGRCSPFDLAQALLDSSMIVPVESVASSSCYSSTSRVSDPYPCLVFCGTIKQVQTSAMDSPEASAFSQQHSEISNNTLSGFHVAERSLAHARAETRQPDESNHVDMGVKSNEGLPESLPDHCLSSTPASMEDNFPVFHTTRWYQIPDPEEAIKVINPMEAVSPEHIQKLYQYLQFLNTKRVKKELILSILASRKKNDQLAENFIQSLPRHVINKYPWLYIREQTVLACLGLMM